MSPFHVFFLKNNHNGEYYITSKREACIDVLVDVFDAECARVQLPLNNGSRYIATLSLSIIACDLWVDAVGDKDIAVSSDQGNARLFVYPNL